MSNIVKHAEFKKVVDALWNKAKLKFAKLDEDNIFTANNTFNEKTLLLDGYIKKEIVLNNTNATQAMNQAISISTCERLTVPKGQKVEKMVVAVKGDLPTGNNLTNIKVGVLKVSDKILMEYITENGTYQVEDNSDNNLNCAKTITIPLNDRSWNEDVMLMVGGIDILWGGTNADGGIGYGGDHDHKVGDNVGETTYRVQATIYGKEISLNDLVSKIGAVEKDSLTINGQAGTGGNVTISMNNTNDNITFAVEGQTYGTLPYVTDTDADDIIDLFV